VVDWDGLENRCGCKLTVGSNPTLSASPGNDPLGSHILRCRDAEAGDCGSGFTRVRPWRPLLQQLTASRKDRSNTQSKPVRYSQIQPSRHRTAARIASAQNRGEVIPSWEWPYLRQMQATSMAMAMTSGLSGKSLRSPQGGLDAGRLRKCSTWALRLRMPNGPASRRRRATGSAPEGLDCGLYRLAPIEYQFSRDSVGNVFSGPSRTHIRSRAESKYLF
jgi:hypothetical protein